MSVIRYQPDTNILQNQRSIDYLDRQGNQEKPYCLRHFNRSRNKVNTKSLQSIEFNKGSIIIPYKAKASNRRKLMSLQRNEGSELQSERHVASEHSSKRIIFENNLKRMNRPERMRTIEESSLQFKEKKIKDCIELMQGVLEEIQNQKSQKQSVRQKRKLGEENQAEKTMIEKSSKEGSLSKFESYVKNICNFKQDSKIIILRKAKTKSVLNINGNREAVKSTAILNAHKFQTIQHERPKEIQPYDPSSTKKRSIKPYFGGSMEKQVKKLDELQCSSIDPVNQSSFISQFGKKSLIKHLQQDSSREKSILESNNKLLLKLKNHRKLKNVFPDGFF